MVGSNLCLPLPASPDNAQPLREKSRVLQNQSANLFVADRARDLRSKSLPKRKCVARCRRCVNRKSQLAELFQLVRVAGRIVISLQQSQTTDYLVGREMLLQLCR